MVMAAKCGIHLKPHLEYQCMNQLKPLAKLNPSEKAELGLLAQLVDEFLDEVEAVVAMVC